MAKAKEQGVYTVNGARFLIRKGDELPDGAEMAEAAAPETPEATPAKADDKKAAQTGPSETTDAATAPEKA